MGSEEGENLQDMNSETWIEVNFPKPPFQNGMMQSEVFLMLQQTKLYLH